MPRRPRPTNRPPPKPFTSFQPSSRQQAVKLAQPARPKAVDFLSSPDTSNDEGGILIGNGPHDSSDAGKLSSDAGSSDEDEEKDVEDADAPRVSQWVDDVDLDVEGSAESSSAGSGSDDSDEDEQAWVAGPSQHLRTLQNDLSTLPMGVLRNAQRSLARTQGPSDAESDSEDETGDDELPSGLPKGKGRANPDQLVTKKKDPSKRANKHAPSEVTSKRPVSRRRTVVEDKMPQPRDPRFLQVTGKYDPLQFRQRYDFLSGMHTVELKTLRENLKRARRLLINSPRDLRTEREQEVRRLELAVKRGESAVNRDTREKVEVEALRKVKEVEKEKRKHGKAEWWMKQSEKRELLTKARFEAIASVGGKQAVKKAIEKKQRKINQKEKKSRPFPGGASAGGSGGRPIKKRSNVSGDEGRGPKRRRLT